MGAYIDTMCTSFIAFTVLSLHFLGDELEIDNLFMDFINSTPSLLYQNLEKYFSSTFEI